MKILFKILIVFTALLGILHFVAGTEMHIERDIIINRSNDDVFENIKYLKNHEKWNAWILKDPYLKKNYKGEDGTIGFTSFWESGNPEVGQGEQEITSIKNGRLETIIRIKVPFEAEGNMDLSLDKLKSTLETPNL